MINPYFIAILAIILFSWLLELLTEYLNLQNLQDKLPQEFQDFYDQDRYAKSQQYTRQTTRTGLIESTQGVVIILLMILLGGFNYIDQFARGFGWSDIPSGLVFAGVLMLGGAILELPYSIYSTFVIEEKYGFNKTTPKTFIIDILKGLLLACLIGAPLFALVIWFFGHFGDFAWLYVWISLTIFSMIMMYIAPVVILPLFNKFKPLEEGELKQGIERLATVSSFKLKGIFIMDGSKRSSKGNAFFTGFGKWKRIALYDTLIEKHTVPELLAVLAHEIGHYKKKHILKHLVISVLSNGLMLFVLSLFINNQRLFDAFKMQNVSIYASLVFVSLLYSPISMIISLFIHSISRRHEFEADAFAAKITGDPESMISALIKLSVDNLSNLTPHPLKVFLEYSHPPVLKRIRSIRTSVV